MSEFRIPVAAERPYDVVIGHGTVAHLSDLLDSATRVAVIHPADLTDLAHAVLAEGPSLTHILVPAGEPAKTPAVLTECWRALAQAGLTREDTVVGLGGGATTDLAGFAAATWLRGVPYVAVPTTVLAMADASVGGKTGVNLPEGKNLVGAFYEPRAVLCDLDLLASLPQPEVASGLAEVAKAGFIADARIDDLISADPVEARDTSSDRFSQILARAVAVKAAVVSRDLREATSTGHEVGREALNYGHTLAHAIERQSGYTWRHGDAVSVGMVFAGHAAERLGLLSAHEVARQRRLLAAIGLPTSYNGADWADLRATMALDKKARGTTLRLVLLDGPRRPLILGDVPDDVLADAFAALAT
jgi:3-dehydroquinate synthase